MAKTTPVYARIDSDLKENAEKIMLQLGVTPSSLIQMVYSQIVLKRRIPFDLSLEDSVPIAMGSLTREELDKELQRGVQSLNQGNLYSASEVDAFLESRK